MSHLQRLNTLKTIYDMNPTGPLGNYVVLNFGKELAGYSGNNQYFVQNGCVAFGNPDYNCNHNQISYSNSAYYSDRVRIQLNCLSMILFSSLSNKKPLSVSSKEKL